jgi:hypothetical protein
MFSRDKMLEQLGSPHTNRVVERLQRFCFAPPQQIESLAHKALN